MDDRQKWDPREDESEKAYKAFEFYRDLGEDRSRWKAWLDYAEWNFGEERRHQEEHKAAAARANKNRPPTPGSITRWMNENDWVTRAKAWDTHLARLRQKARESEHLEELASHRDRQKRFAKESLETAKNLMAKIQVRIESLADKDLESPQTLAKLIRANVQLFRAATEAEAQALAVDEILVILDEQGKTF